MSSFQAEPFQSTPSSRKATGGYGGFSVVEFISIHTFLAEGDSNSRSLPAPSRYFNPHLPRGRRQSVRYRSRITGSISIHTFLAEGDRNVFGAGYRLRAFQSTPSSRKATDTLLDVPQFLRYFNPHLPRGRRPASNSSILFLVLISIHTFLAEGDMPWSGQ